MVRAGVHHVDAEIVACQRLGDAAVGDADLLCLPILRLLAHLGVDVAHADDDVIAIPVLQAGDFHADPGGRVVHHQPVAQGEGAVPVQRALDVFLGEHGEERALVLLVHDALDVLPTQVEKVLAAARDAEIVECAVAAVFDVAVGVHVHVIDAEVILGQCLGDAGIGDAGVVRLFVGLPGHHLLVDAADANDDVALLLLDHPRHLQVNVGRPLPKQHPEGHGEGTVGVQRGDDVLLGEGLQKALPVLRQDDFFKVVPRKADDVVSRRRQAEFQILRRRAVLDEPIRFGVDIVDAEVIRRKRLRHAGLRNPQRFIFHEHRPPS